MFDKWVGEYAFWKGQRRVENKVVYSLRSDSSKCGSLTVLIIDDKIRQTALLPIAPNSLPPVRYTDADFLVRAAGFALEHQDVREVIITNFGIRTKTLEFIIKRWSHEINENRLCALIDVFGPNDNERLGIHAARILCNIGGLKSRNCAIFSKSSDPEMEKEFKIETVILKPTKAKTDQVFKRLRNEISDWLDRCASYHRPLYCVNVGHDALIAVGKMLAEEFHMPAGSKHEIKQCLGEGTKAPKSIQNKYMNSLRALNVDPADYIAALTAKNMIDPGMLEKLFLPLFDPEVCGAERSFVFSKAISRYYTKCQKLVPGYWFEILFEIGDIKNLGRFVFSCGNTVPMSGFLHLCYYLNKKISSSIRAEFRPKPETNKGELMIQALINAGDEGEDGLRRLSKAIETEYNNLDSSLSEGILGEQVGVFAQFFRSGALLYNTPQVSEGTLLVPLRFEMIRLQ